MGFASLPSYELEDRRHHGLNAHERSSVNLIIMKTIRRRCQGRWMRNARRCTGKRVGRQPLLIAPVALETRFEGATKSNRSSGMKISSTS